MKSKTIITVKYLFKRLVQSPLLLGWIIVGTIIEIIHSGYHGFIITFINLILLALFTVIIKIMTNNQPIKFIPKLKHSRLELFSGVILLILIFIAISIVSKQVEIPYISSGILNLLTSMGDSISKLDKIGIPEWILPILTNASIVAVLMLIPTIVLFLFWGYGFRSMGFIFSNLPLTLVLLGVTIILGLPTKILLQQPFDKIILTFFISIFINGLPEELIMRGYLLPRLEVVLKNPINALVITAILFNMGHIPSELARGMSIYQASLFSFSIVYPSGLIWGYLYLKTRSIVPGVIWHTSNAIIGVIFIGIS